LPGSTALFGEALVRDRPPRGRFFSSLDHLANGRKEPLAEIRRRCQTCCRCAKPWIDQPDLWPELA